MTPWPSIARRPASDGVILVGGEALYDFVLEGSDELRGHPGGGPFNTARTVARLQQPAAYLGRLSTDRFGVRLARLLEEDGVSLDTVVRTDQPTTLAIAEIDDDGTRYRFYTDGTSAPGLTTEEALAAVPETVDILHVGTLGLALEPVGTALEAVVQRLAGRALIAVDPNIRPTVIPDRSAFSARLARVLASADLIKVSEEDLEWLEPNRSAVEATRRLLAYGPAVALLTQGGEGALVITAHDELRVPAPPVRVVDTIGAGDAFGGGFLAWWRSRGLRRGHLDELELVKDATRFACLVAARTVERAGASPPRLEELAGAV